MTFLIVLNYTIFAFIYGESNLFLISSTFTDHSVTGVYFWLWNIIVLLSLLVYLQLGMKNRWDVVRICFFWNENLQPHRPFVDNIGHLDVQLDVALVLLWSQIGILRFMSVYFTPIMQ